MNGYMKEDMTDEEKAAHQPMKQQAVISKCLMNLNVVSCGRGSLSDRRKEIIKAIPNFDAEIFFQCTGVGGR